MGKFLRNLTIGGVIGFVAGMLFAPQKGEETRKKVQDMLDKGKEKLNEIKEEFSKDSED